MTRNVTVSASLGGIKAINSFLKCAERRLLRMLVRAAWRRGVPARALATWAHRKFGAVRVERCLADGKPSCSLPCMFCRRAMSKSGLAWEARGWGGETFRSACDPPPAVLTSGQRWMFGR